MNLSGDIKFFYINQKPGDMQVTPNTPDVIMDKGFKTSVTIALSTDRRAEDSDILPAGETDRRGWFGDALEDIPIGTKRWLLERSKINDETLTMAAQYDTEALEYLKTDGIADSIEMVATRDPTLANRVKMSGKIIKEGKIDIYLEYYLNWKHMQAGTD